MTRRLYWFPGKAVCPRENRLGICLVSIASRLLADIIFDRLLNARERFMLENRTGFRPVYLCIDQIFTQWHTLESAISSWPTWSCIPVALPHIKRCSGQIHFSLPIFVFEQPNSSSWLRRSFTQVHYEKWCLSGLPLFIRSFEIFLLQSLWKSPYPHVRMMALAFARMKGCLTWNMLRDFVTFSQLSKRQ